MQTLKHYEQPKIEVLSVYTEGFIANVTSGVNINDLIIQEEEW